jgi:hypothetical protein
MIALARPYDARAVVIFQAREGIGGKAIMKGFDDPIIRIKPTRIVSWGLEDGFQARSVG